MLTGLQQLARLLRKPLGSESRTIYDMTELGSADTLSVSFTGGMGAQILSAAIYFDLKQRGISAKADLSYFSKPSRVAKAGNGKEMSHWEWQLDEYGLTPISFQMVTSSDSNECKYSLPDGALKMQLAMCALQKESIKACFPMPPLYDLFSFLPPGSNQALMAPYACLHIRRGDYVNVASYMVPEEDFISLCSRFSSLVSSVVVVSDSDCSGVLKAELEKKFSHVVFLDGAVVSAFVTHCVMRYATILACSNSQYSLTAGALNNGISLVPKKWFGEGHDLLKKQIDLLSQFSVLS